MSEKSGLPPGFTPMALTCRVAPPTLRSTASFVTSGEVTGANASGSGSNRKTGQMAPPWSGTRTGPRSFSSDVMIAAPRSWPAPIAAKVICTSTFAPGASSTGAAPRVNSLLVPASSATDRVSAPRPAFSSEIDDVFWVNSVTAPNSSVSGVTTRMPDVSSSPCVFPQLHPLSVSTDDETRKTSVRRMAWCPNGERALEG